MSTVLHSREEYSSEKFDSVIEEIHGILGEERITADENIEDINPGDDVTYRAGDLEISIRYLESGDTVGFLQSYD